MGFLTWIFPRRAIQRSETERRQKRDEEIEHMKKLETEKLSEVQRAAALGDQEATVQLRNYAQALDAQSLKMLREEPKPKLG